MSIKSSQDEFIKSFNLSPFLPTKASHSHFESKPLQLRVIEDLEYYSSANVETISLRDFLKAKVFMEIQKGQQILPAVCQECCWQKICGGGAIVNRFNRANSFNNPSVFCNGLQLLYKELANYLISNGFSIDDVSSRLSLN